MNNRRSYHKTDKAGRSEWGEWEMKWCKVKNIGLVELKRATGVDKGVLSAMSQQYPQYRLSCLRSKKVRQILFDIIMALKDKGDGRGGLKTRQEAYEGIVLFKKNPYAELSEEDEGLLRAQIDDLFPPDPIESKESSLIRALTDLLAGKKITWEMLVELHNVINQAIKQYKNQEEG